MRDRPIDPRLIVGVALLLLYVVPLFVPPAAQPLVTPASDATLLVRVFPNVPQWWMVGRLLALIVGAVLIASVKAGPVLHLPPAVREPAGWTRPWVIPVALLAALAQVVLLPWLSLLPTVAQHLFMLWFVVPGALLAWGTARRRKGWYLESGDWQRVAPVLGVIAFWFVSRLVISWHSPRAADGVDMWRTFGRLVQITATNANFLTERMDPQLPGVTCMEHYFHGLPLLQVTAHAPSLGFAQVNSACLLALAALGVAALCAAVVGPGVAPIAAAAFLFSPMVLLFQLYPMSAAGWLLVVTVLALLVVTFFRARTPAALALFGAGAGMTASFPTLGPMTALALLLVAWRVWHGPRVPWMVLGTACLSFVAGFVAGFGIPSGETLREMVNRYYLLHWSWAIGELAMQGQLSPTIADWTGPKSPAWYVIPFGALVSPFAVARNSLRLWGDVMFEPLSAALFAVGIALCIRRSRRDRVSLSLLAFLAASMVGAITSTYDRPSQLRFLGATIPLALLAAAGFRSIAASVPSVTVRRRVAFVVALAITASGTVMFDVVNPRLLAASAIGLAMRSVDASQLERTVLLTANGVPRRNEDDPMHRHWEVDWLRANHAYTDDIVRTVAARPIPIVTLEAVAGDPEGRSLFWSPALEETAEISAQICSTWRDAGIYTITDAAGLSRVYAARPTEPGWTPAVPQEQWRKVQCEQGRVMIEAPPHFQPSGKP